MDTKTLNKKIDTWLPVFTGFYNTIWEFDYDNVIYNINEDRQELKLHPINTDILEVDDSQYEYDIVESFIESLKMKLSDFIIDIQFQKIQSPKEYNFVNDSVDVSITPKIDKIKEYIYNHLEDYKIYLKNQYTCYDGFISHYNNDFESWKEYTDNFTNYSKHCHYLGSVLNFICESLEDSTELELNIYYAVSESIYTGNYVTNYDKCVNSLICSKCDKIIEDKNIIDKSKQYNDIMGQYPSKIHCIECMNEY